MKKVSFSIFTFLISTAFSQSFQDKKTLITIEALSALKFTNYHYKDFNQYEQKKYSKYYPFGYGLQLGIYNYKYQIGLKASFIDFKTNKTGYDYTLYPLRPDPNIPKSVEFIYREQRTKFYPYYNFIKNEKYVIGVGPLVTFINNNFATEEKLIMSDGSAKPSSEFTSQFNKTNKISYGLQLELGARIDPITINLFTTYELMNDKYFTSQQLQSAGTFLIGFSIGYGLNI